MDDPRIVDQQLEQIRARLDTLEGSDTQLEDHFHNGNDVSKISFNDIAVKKVWVHHTIQGANAATATNYGVFWVAPFACLVNSFKEVHQVLGTDAGTVTVMLEKVTGTTVPGSGSAILDTALSLKATINTLQTASITATDATRLYRTLAIGDRLSMKLAGTPTAVSSVTVMVELIIL
jgi:hypothetical protein